MIFNKNEIILHFIGNLLLVIQGREKILKSNDSIVFVETKHSQKKLKMVWVNHYKITQFENK